MVIKMAIGHAVVLKGDPDNRQPDGDTFPHAYHPAHSVDPLQVIELSDTAFYPDQIHRLSRMRILMGVHGAGLGNMIWMEPEAGGVVEVMHNAGGLNTHYAQMGEWMG